jgi:hypothetical protein
MSKSAIIQIQENLRYPPLKKIDPNTQKVTHTEGETLDQSFSQAAIPSILAALYRSVQSNDGAAAFLARNNSYNLLAILFGEKREEAIRHISAYSGETNEYTFAKMQAIAEETVGVIKELLPANAAVQDVKSFFKNEKNNILTYLPGELQMGKLLDDDSIDDETQKMEGVVSGIMHSIGTAFDTTEAKEDIPEEVNK